jgi:ligand-binding SRPBCC domain-containing protein
MALHRLLGAPPRRPRHPEHLHRETIVPATLEQTFAFFADAARLEWLTPTWLAFRVLSPLPVSMRTGAEIDYHLTVYGLSIPWRSVIDVWEPDLCFIDRQTIGPYRWWRHEHRFDPVAGGTRIIDHVEYLPRLRWMTAAIVRRDLARIFDYRQLALRRHFESLADEHRRA